MPQQGFVLTDRTIRMVADNKIQAAIDDGQFANLPGLGQPLPDLGAMSDTNWWLRRMAQREKLRDLAEQHRAERDAKAPDAERPQGIRQAGA